MDRLPAHRKCHREHTAAVDAPLIAKTRRQHKGDEMTQLDEETIARVIRARITPIPNSKKGAVLTIRLVGVEEVARAILALLPAPAEPSSDLARLARHHEIDLRQCSIFARDAGPSIEKAMLEAADFLAAAVIPAAERIAELEKALTPSAETKAAYIGEFSFFIPDQDEDGDEVPRCVVVPWTTVKEIMAAIRARAALRQTQEPNT